MHLHSKVYGSESLPALIVLHGLLGSSDNWHSFAQKFCKHYFTCTLDARNHGRSPHSESFNYQVMAEDVVEFMKQQNITSAALLGHSMGGKTAALTALLYPELVDKLIVVDIAPRSYKAHHDQVFDALTSINLNDFRYRKDIDEALTLKIPEISVRQFLMKNLARDETGSFRWKMNLEVIEINYAQINQELPRDKRFMKPTLFIRGGNSDYIPMDDLPLIAQLFPGSEVITIKDAGHWIHVDAPDEFSQIVFDFLSL